MTKEMTYSYRNKKYLAADWYPIWKEDLVDLLIDVQAGQTSCRKAADILFPHLQNSKK